MGIELRCTAGPAAGERITIDAELVLGRDQSEPGRLQGDPRLSRRHARLFINDGGQAAIEDLGSTNGTSVNGERITTARILTTGDEVHAGQTTLRVEVTAQAAETQLDTVRTVASPTVGRAPSRGPALLVVAGPSKGEAIPLGTELLIGRGFGEPGALGGDRQLSRRHARIARGPGGVFYVEDTGSTNGTMLNGVGLRRAHAIKDGDEIQLGASRLDARGLPRAPLTVELEEAPVAAPGFDPWQRARPAGAPPAGTSAAVPGSGYAAATPGFEFAAGSQFMPRGAAGARLSSRRVIGVFAGVFAAAAIVAAVLVLISAPLGSRACAQGFICHKPPTAPPLQALTTFSGALGWRVEYDPQVATPASANAIGNQLVLRESDALDRNFFNAPPGSGIIAVVLHAYPSSQTSPQAAIRTLASGIASNLVGAAPAPNSDQMFGQPVLGFHPAQGGVLEGSQQTPQGPGNLMKVAVLAAASGRVTIGAAIVYAVQRGQHQQNNPDAGLDQFGDQILSTVRFPSDGQT